MLDVRFPFGVGERGREGRAAAALLALALLAGCTSAVPPDLPFAVAPGAEGDQGSVSVEPEPGAVVIEDSGRAYEGRVCARAATPGGAGNKFARVVRGGTSGEIDALSYGEADSFWFGVAVYLPAGFSSSVASYFSPLRWDNFGVDQVSRGGLAMYEDGRLHLFRERDGVEDQVDLLAGASAVLAEDQWHWLEVHQRLSERDGDALNELYVNGERVGRSRARNYYGEPVSAVRYGIVAVSQQDQTEPLELWFDRAVLGPRQTGPARD